MSGSSSKRIATQLHARYGSLPDVQFSVDINWTHDDKPGVYGIRVDWTEPEQGLPVHGLMWHASSEDEAQEVLRWLNRL